MKIEVVSHCQAIQRTYYEALLTYQLSGFVLYPPKNCDLLITICCCEEDKATQKVIDYFLGLNKLNLNTIILTPRELGRRAIGRNIVAKNTKADIIWFTDVDHVFRLGCLDSLISSVSYNNPNLLFPKWVQAQTDFDLAIDDIKKVRNAPRVIDIDEARGFASQICTTPTGAYQIVSGEFARKYGYLVHSHLLKPTHGSFVSCRGDVSFRNRFLELEEGVWKRIGIPNIYRLRHPVKDMRRIPKRFIGRIRPEHSAKYYQDELEDN